MKNKAQKQKRIKPQGSTLFCIALGVISTLIIMFILLMFFSCIAVNTKKPHSYISALSFFAIYSSAFFGGFIATKKNNGRDPLLCGSLTGIISALILCLLFLAIGAFFDTQSTPMSWLFRGLTIIFSLFGSLIAIKKQKTSKSIRKRRKKQTHK